MARPSTTVSPMKTSARSSTPSIKPFAAGTPTAEDSSRRKHFRRRHVHQSQLHPLLTLTAVEREAADCMHRASLPLQQRGAELLACGTESDGVDDGAVARAQPGAHMRLTYLLRIDERMRG